jgi:hypothetical protein
MAFSAPQVERPEISGRRDLRDLEVLVLPKMRSVIYMNLKLKYWLEFGVGAK